MKRFCVVTGASSGIGRAVVEKLVTKGFFVFAGVRRESDGSGLERRFDGAVAALRFDVTDAESARRAADEAAGRMNGAILAGLVNNAGTATPGPLLHLPLDDFRRQMEINLVGQLAVIQAFAPLLGARHGGADAPGRIVNISSTAGRVATPFLGAYCASKYGVEGLSDVLRRELLIYGIDVVVVEPGAVRTPIWDKAAQGDYAAFDQTDFGPSFRKLRELMIEEGRKGLAPEKIAAAVFRGLSARRPPARIAVVPQRWKNWTLPRLMPDRALDSFVARLIGLDRIGNRPDAGASPARGAVAPREIRVEADG